MSEKDPDALRGAETAQEVREYMADRNPPAWATVFLRGSQRVSEKAQSVRADFGNDRAEIEFEDGRHVTVKISTELIALAEVRE